MQHLTLDSMQIATPCKASSVPASASNTPEQVSPAEDGSLLLAATNAEIYGDTLLFEEKHSNLARCRAAFEKAVEILVREAELMRRRFMNNLNNSLNNSE